MRGQAMRRPQTMLPYSIQLSTRLQRGRTSAHFIRIRRCHLVGVECHLNGMMAGGTSILMSGTYTVITGRGCVERSAACLNEYFGCTLLSALPNGPPGYFLGGLFYVLVRRWN